MTKRPVKYAWEGVIDPAMGRNIGWRDMMKNDLDDATRFAAEWERLWGQYTPPELSVFGQYFPKWRGEAMSEDRKFAYECAKHVLRQVQIDYDVSLAHVDEAERKVVQATRDLEEARRLHISAKANHADHANALEKAKAVVCALSPFPLPPTPPR